MRGGNQKRWPSRARGPRKVPERGRGGRPQRRTGRGACALAMPLTGAVAVPRQGCSAAKLTPGILAPVSLSSIDFIF